MVQLFVTKKQEIELICNLAGVCPNDIRLYDKGYLSRGYVINDGEIVFKFPKQDFVKYDNEAMVLGFLDNTNFVNELNINLQRVNQAWTDEKDFRYIGFHGVRGESVSDMFKKDKITPKQARGIGKQIAKFLLKLHAQQVETTVCKTLDDEIKEMLRIWQGRKLYAKEIFDKNFTEQEQMMMDKLVTNYVPTKLGELGERLVFSHGDMHEGNTFIDGIGKVGLIDFDNAGYYDEARDFMRVDDDDILNAMLDAYNDNITFRQKVEIRREIIRPLTMLAQNLFPDDYLQRAKETVKKYYKIC